MLNPAPDSISKILLDTSAVRTMFVKTVTFEAPDILSYDIRAVDGGDLSSFTAGAHVDVILPTGLRRSYSLLNAQHEQHRYLIAVQKDRASLGGSQWIHANLHAGDSILVSQPRNNFPLDETAEKSVFIAGGIGVTPMLSMSQRLTAIGSDWDLYYCARSRACAAFADALHGNVTFSFDDEQDGKMFDIPALVGSLPNNTHLYCCGPTSMIRAFEDATQHLPRNCVHVEHFKATEASATEGGFMLVLARSQRQIPVPSGKTILAALLEAGIEAPYSCTEGVCGACEVRVLDGIPDHRDMILNNEERAANRTIMICCSGSKSNYLVLDL